MIEDSSVGHMFVEKESRKWHFFYFDQRDTSEQANHWVGGSHIHLTNYLWPNADPVTLLERFTKGNPLLRSALHIRFDQK
jgi:hypothetical protein